MFWSDLHSFESLYLSDFTHIAELTSLGRACAVPGSLDQPEAAATTPSEQPDGDSAHPSQAEAEPASPGSPAASKDTGALPGSSAPQASAKDSYWDEDDELEEEVKGSRRPHTHSHSQSSGADPGCCLTWALQSAAFGPET